jgi:hypothetical protein
MLAHKLLEQPEQFAVANFGNGANVRALIMRCAQSSRRDFSAARSSRTSALAMTQSICAPSMG